MYGKLVCWMNACHFLTKFNQFLIVKIIYYVDFYSYVHSNVFTSASNGTFSVLCLSGVTFHLLVHLRGLLLLFLYGSYRSRSHIGVVTMAVSPCILCACCIVILVNYFVLLDLIMYVSNMCCWTCRIRISSHKRSCCRRCETDTAVCSE